VSYQKLAATHQNGEQYQEAINWYRKVGTVLEGLEKADRLAPSQIKWIGIVKDAITNCQKKLLDP